LLSITTARQNADIGTVGSPCFRDEARHCDHRRR
jgi:hypothetical protein